MMNANDFEMEYLSPLITPVFTQIARCIESPNYTVGERALTMWNSDFIRWLCAELRDIIFVIIAPSLLRNVANHWSENVRSLSDDVRDVFKDIDPLLWQDREFAYNKAADADGKEKQARRLRSYETLKQRAEEARKKLNLDSPTPLPLAPPADESPLSLDTGVAEEKDSTQANETNADPPTSAQAPADKQELTLDDPATTDPPAASGENTTQENKPKSNEELTLDPPEKEETTNDRN